MASIRKEILIAAPPEDVSSPTPRAGLRGRRWARVMKQTLERVAV